MTEYRINCRKKSFHYDEIRDIISISSVDTSVLSNNEMSKYVADSLTHEYIHKVLYDMFNTTVCKLFDGIQQYFRDAPLQERIFVEYSGKECYHKFIERRGFDAFLEYYHIDNTALNQAYIICGSK